MTIVTIHKAKTELSKLLERVEAGEEIIIARGAKPIAKIITLASPFAKQPRIPGSMKHLLGKIPDDIWFEPLPEEELKLWEGVE